MNENVQRWMESVRLAHGYTERSREVRTMTDRMRDAHTVTSYTVDGYHAPVLDVDHPVAVVRRGGTSGVWIDTNVPKWRLQRLQRHLVRNRIGAHLPLDPQWRREEWERCRGAALDLAAIDETLQELGPESEGSFEALHDVTTAAVGESVGDGPEMQDPVLLPFTCPVRLVASGRYSHLYLETRLTWREYKKLLKLLRGAGIVEKEWVRLAKRHHQSSVRLPWITKDW